MLSYKVHQPYKANHFSDGRAGPGRSDVGGVLQRDDPTLRRRFQCRRRVAILVAHYAVAKGGCGTSKAEQTEELHHVHPRLPAVGPAHDPAAEAALRGGPSAAGMGRGATRLEDFTFWRSDCRHSKGSD